MGERLEQLPLLPREWPCWDVAPAPEPPTAPLAEPQYRWHVCLRCTDASELLLSDPDGYEQQAYCDECETDTWWIAETGGEDDEE